MAQPVNPIEPTPITEPELKSLRVYSNDDPSGSTVYKVAGEGGSSSFDLSDRIAKGEGEGAVIEGRISGNHANIANGNYAHAEGSGTKATGTASHAEGASTDASGTEAHAEGSGTKATGTASHAEGASTEASGDSSHAEGEGTEATGAHAHAEGGGTKAIAVCAHAEGNTTTASGANAHAEGLRTNATGSCSHAEGFITMANGKSEHVFGEYNVPSNPANANTRSTYVEIVGNGTGESARSNARTLDWSGNESLSGSLTLGMGTANEVTLTAGDLRALLGLLSQS